MLQLIVVSNEETTQTLGFSSIGVHLFISTVKSPLTLPLITESSEETMLSREFFSYSRGCSLPRQMLVSSGAEVDFSTIHREKQLI